MIRPVLTELGIFLIPFVAYAMFLIALANIAMAILLALGPLFIALLFFETTKRFFSATRASCFRLTVSFSGC